MRTGFLEQRTRKPTNLQRRQGCRVSYLLGGDIRVWSWEGRRLGDKCGGLGERGVWVIGKEGGGEGSWECVGQMAVCGGGDEQTVCDWMG